jgi:hypothetical protein
MTPRPLDIISADGTARVPTIQKQDRIITDILAVATRDGAAMDDVTVGMVIDILKEKRVRRMLEGTIAGTDIGTNAAIMGAVRFNLKLPPTKRFNRRQAMMALRLRQQEPG